MLWEVLLGALVAVLVIVGLTFFRKSAPAPSPPVVQREAEASPASRPASPDARAGVTVEIKTSPVEAAIYLDGKRLPRNPATVRLPLDKGVHEIRVEAAGYLPLTKREAFQRDSTLDIALEKLAGPTPKRPGTKKASGPAPEKIDTGKADPKTKRNYGF